MIDGDESAGSREERDAFNDTPGLERITVACVPWTRSQRQ
jgi:hypothetical protein